MIQQSEKNDESHWRGLSCVSLLQRPYNEVTVSEKPSGPASLIFGLDTNSFGDLNVVVKDSSFLAAHSDYKYYVSTRAVPQNS